MINKLPPFVGRGIVPLPVIPTEYTDALSYGEQVGTMIHKLDETVNKVNEVIEDNETFKNDITEQQDEFESTMQEQYDGFLEDYQRQFGVVQDKGISITNVMSQKAVSDEFEKVIYKPNNTWGLNGQVLESTGDGVKWSDVGAPTQSQVNRAVTDWLDEHPEATTTVDFTITYKVYNSVADMKDDVTIENGYHVSTSGYYDADDGGGAVYIVKNTVPDSYYETLDNGLYAELISDKHNILCYGAKNNEKSNSAIENAILNNDNYIYVPSGKFIISDTPITISSSINIIGGGNSSILDCQARIIINGVAEQHYILSRLKFIGNRCVELGANGICLDTEISHCWFDTVTSAIELYGECDGIRIIDNHFLRCTSSVKCTSNSTNKTNILLMSNHIQMQPSNSIGLELFNCYNLNITNNILQCTTRDGIKFIKINDTNNYIINNNYFEFTNSEQHDNIPIEIGGTACGEINNNCYVGAFIYIINILRPTYGTCKIGKIYYVGHGYNVTRLINHNYTSNDVDKIKLDYTILEIVNSTTEIVNNLNGINTYDYEVCHVDSMFVSSPDTPYEIDLTKISNIGVGGLMLYTIGNMNVAPLMINMLQNISITVEGNGTIAYNASMHKLTFTKGTINLALSVSLIKCC